MDLAAWFAFAREVIAEELPPASDLRSALSGAPSLGPSVHLAVFVEPFLGFVLDGTKRIESRFSTVRSAPFDAVKPGDVLLMKEASGPVVAAATAKEVRYFAALSDEVRKELRVRFGPELRDDVPGFWEQRRTARFATLIRLESVTRLTSPIRCPKRDRRGWVVLRQRPTQLSLMPS